VHVVGGGRTDDVLAAVRLCCQARSFPSARPGSQRASFDAHWIFFLGWVVFFFFGFLDFLLFYFFFFFIVIFSFFSPPPPFLSSLSYMAPNLLSSNPPRRAVSAG